MLLLSDFYTVGLHQNVGGGVYISAFWVLYGMFLSSLSMCIFVLLFPHSPKKGLLQHGLV